MEASCLGYLGSGKSNQTGHECGLKGLLNSWQQRFAFRLAVMLEHNRLAANDMCRIFTGLARQTEQLALLYEIKHIT